MLYETGRLYRWKINYDKGDNPVAVQKRKIKELTVRLVEIRLHDRHKYELNALIDPRLSGVLPYHMLWNIDSEDIYALAIDTEEQLSELLETV